jgi:hypothetical protein
MLDDHSPLPVGQRLQVVGALLGTAIHGRAIRATTEWKDVDLLLTIEEESGCRYVALENKIKATEGHFQLSIYDRRLDQLPGEVRKVFLTLTGEAPRSGRNWRAVSYATLLDALCALPKTDDSYVNDFRDALSRLVAIPEVARTEVGGLVSVAFDDDGAAEQTEITEYVEQMRLQKMVQRIWMMDLAAALEVSAPWQSAVDETRGQAILNIQGTLKDRKGYLVGLQLQWRTLKAFCVPYPYPTKATDEQHRVVEETLETMRGALGLGEDARPSARRARGFRSFSVDTMPSGRRRDEWHAALKPHVKKLVSAFPAVNTPAGEPPPLPDED